MNYATLRNGSLLVAILGGSAASVAAQQAVTVSGHVTAGGAAVVGAHVRITSLRPEVDRTTDIDGYYSFIVGSSNVHGQTVRMTVTMSDRRVKYAPASVDIKLVGVPVTQDVDLKITSGELPLTPNPEAPQPAGRGGTRRQGPAVTAATHTDSANLGELAGAVDLASALAGRIAGLSVTNPGVLGGSPTLVYRGPRSFLGSNQPLFVVDGVTLENEVVTSTAQRFGVGGFDYGSPLQDLDLSTIATIRFLQPAQAAARYGGRAANGVVEITTKDGQDGPGFAVSAGQQITSETPGRLPVFQNQYGQGLNGKFQFFDGKGGGISDGVDQSWGPPLDNRPLAQASLTEVGRGDVRIWSPHANGVRDYFGDGRTLNTTLGVQSATSFGSFRGSFGDRDTKGLTPNSTLKRTGGAFHATLQPADGISATAWVSGARTKDGNAAGTGLNQGNPVAEFTRLGRQVDLEALRTHLLDTAHKQISWNYAGQNNPYFASLENSNESERNHVSGGGSLTWALSPWLDGTVRGGTDYYRQTRNFSIHPGWMGGFPFFGAPAGGDFSKGGFESDEVLGQQTTLTARLDGTRALSSGARWTMGAGADIRSSRDRIRSVGVDSVVNVPAAGAPDTATIPSPASWNAHSKTTAAFGETSVLFSNSGVLRAGLRSEWSSIVPAQHASALYPSLGASIDLVRAISSLHDGRRLNAATVRASWSQSAGELTPYSIQTMYAGRAPSGALVPAGSGLKPDSNLTSEKTNALQVGADLSLFGRKIDLGFTIYHDRTSGVILPVADAVLHTVLAQNAGTVTNNGVEGQATARFGDGDTWLGWEISANAAKNTNLVDQVIGGKGIALAPTQFGLSLQATPGAAIGALVGQRLLRDPSTHALILRGGLPLPDSVTGPVVLGVAQPTWMFGIRNTVRYRWLSVGVLADGHVGGSVFSTTNLSGSFAGTLAETAFRPDSGLLITGIDAVTKAANTKHVSTQDYYHALGAIQEPWVYSASYFKIREVRATLALPASFGGLPFTGLNLSVVARNTYLWAKAPNIDPETQLSPYQFNGIEMGQLPSTKSVGFQISIIP